MQNFALYNLMYVYVMKITVVNKYFSINYFCKKSLPIFKEIQLYLRT